MINRESILSIRNAAQQERAKGKARVTIGIPALLQLCDLAIEHPLVESAN